MWRKIWRHRVEFYPYFIVYFLVFFNSLSAAKVQNRPGIMTVGILVIPSLVLFAIAAINTYRELP